MKKQVLLCFLLSGLMIMSGCKKELSFESGGPSEGTLQDDGSGDCLPKTVAGVYVVNTALVGATNYIEVEVNVTSVGTYTIYTDTLNGMFFRASGVFPDSGLVTVRLTGHGTPLAAQVDNFTVQYGASFCSVAVTTAATLAVFTLDGAPATCMNYVLAGTYTAGDTLDAGNTVTINVTVSTPGAYSVTTVVSNGMIFTGSGMLAAGAQTIVLSAAGSTPTTAGSTTIPVTVGSSSCNFLVDVGAPASPATYTINCASTAPNGTYTVNTALDATNTIILSVDVAVAGSYTITGTINNMTFTKSGVFAAAGAGQSVTLTGSGIPNTPGANIVPLTGGTAPCNVTVNVNPAAGGAATFTINCTSATVNGIYVQNTALTTSNTVTLSVNVTTGGTYDITTTATNGMTFTSGAGTWTAGAQTLTLTGSGTPNASGTIFIPIAAGTNPCNFLVVVSPPAAATDYFPRTTNSNWSYEFDDVASDSIYRTVIAPTFNALGNVYNIFMHNDGSGLDSSGYYRKAGGDYFEYLDVGSFIGFDDPAFAEYTMLKDNVAAGTNWKSNGFTGMITIAPNPPQSLTLRFSYTILQKDVPVTVVSSTGSITYQNVIVVEEKYEQFTGGIWVDVTALIDFYGKSYYARGIGLVKYEGLDANNVVQFSQELRRWVVY